MDLPAKPDLPCAKDRRDTRQQLVEVVATVEGSIADPMLVSGSVRRETLATSAARAGRETSEGARPIKVGRNEKGPCGSGKKLKRCEVTGSMPWTGPDRATPSRL